MDGPTDTDPGARRCECGGAMRDYPIETGASSLRLEVCSRCERRQWHDGDRVVSREEALTAMTSMRRPARGGSRGFR